MLRRRTFCMGAIGLGASTLFGAVPNIAKHPLSNKTFALEMEGDLDDDLMVTIASPLSWEMQHCFQMHNPIRTFTLDGKTTPSVHIPGWIEHSTHYAIGGEEVLMAVLANEREERDNTRGLLSRTHYKSCELTINGEVLIPRMNPDLKDIANYPTWFGPEDDLAEYNYYRAWENAVVNVGLVLPKEGYYRISLASEKGTVVASSIFNATKTTSNPRFYKTILGTLDEHPMSEMDGGVFLAYMKKQPNDDIVRNLAARYVLVQAIGGESVAMPLPYPFPYPNRIFCKVV